VICAWVAADTALGASDHAAFGAEIKRIFGNVPDRIRNFQTQEPEQGVLFVGSKGWMFVGRERVAGDGIGELSEMPLPDNSQTRWRSCLYYNMFNFVTCVWTRHKPISDAADQHRTLIPCHLTNIAMRLGRRLQRDPAREEFIGDAEANAMLSRTQRDPYRIDG